MKCVVCGTEILPDDKFCQACGTLVPEQDAGSSAAPETSSPFIPPVSSPSGVKDPFAGSPIAGAPIFSDSSNQDSYNSTNNNYGPKPKATGSLVLGILSLVFCCCPVISIIGIIVGIFAKKKTRRNAGLVLSIIAFVLAVVVIIMGWAVFKKIYSLLSGEVEGETYSLSLDRDSWLAFDISSFMKSADNDTFGFDSVSYIFSVDYSSSYVILFEDKDPDDIDTILDGASESDLENILANSSVTQVSDIGDIQDVGGNSDATYLTFTGEVSDSSSSVEDGPMYIVISPDEESMVIVISERTSSADEDDFADAIISDIVQQIQFN